MASGGPEAGGGRRCALLAAALARGLRVRLRVRGGSMAPSLHDGQRIEIEPLRRPPRVGEVVACRVGDRLRVHRVVAFGPAGVVTRGDANGRDDPPLPLGEVLGRARAVGPPPPRWRRVARALRRRFAARPRRVRGR
ncbi:MAG: hypothetical protein D6731_24350 [Planctomycetota bacterium]|nr:MAG: hypothetical protein D6731_24350 [Planctomycetota bacterium]